MRGVVVSCAVVLGCGPPTYEVPEPTTSNVLPFSDAGTGSTFRLGTPLVLDGTNSLDLDGEIVGYAWHVVEATHPVSIVSAQSAMTGVTIDRAGTYTFSLTVTDDDGGTAQSSVMYIVYREALDMNAGPDQAVAWRDTVQLAGTAMSDVTPSPTPSWQFTARPARSASTLANANTFTPSFLADVDGTYTVELTVVDGVNTRTDTVSVVATAERVVLADSTIIDVEFSELYSSFVIATDSPPRLRVISTFGGAEQTIPLPATPHSISVDGNRVAIAFASSFGIASLAGMKYEETFPAPVPIFDIVVAGVFYIHCFPVTAGPIQTYDFGVGDFVPSTFNVRGGTRGRRQPESNEYALYTVDTTTPADLTHLETPGVDLIFVRDSPYAGEHALGGELWFSQDATLIITRAGNVFRATSSAATDMTLVGHLEAIEPAVVEMAGASPAHLATLVTSGTNELRIYDPTTLSVLAALPLPDLVVGGVPQRSQGRALAFDQSGNLFVILGVGTAMAMFEVTP